MEAENVCLRWNDFERSIAVAFQELREDKDFCDMTLACDDELQMEAHKVVLSACSPFFRNVLSRNPHQHPLLYLKGVKYTDLQSILNFMYRGEVIVAQEELDSFLDVADELRVKGLTRDNFGRDGTEDSFNTMSKPPHTIKSAPRPPPSDSTPPNKRLRGGPVIPSTPHPSVSIPFFSGGTSHPNKADDRQIQPFGREDGDNIQEFVQIKSEPRDVSNVTATPSPNPARAQCHALANLEMDVSMPSYEQNSNDDSWKDGVDVINHIYGFKDNVSATKQKKSNLEGSKIPIGIDLQQKMEKIPYPKIVQKPQALEVTEKRPKYFEAREEKSFPNVNKQTFTRGNCQIKTDLNGNTVLKGKEFQPVVEKIAKNYAFQIKKADSFRLNFKKEDVSVRWIFSSGNVHVVINGNNFTKAFTNCTVNQFKSILKNPKNSKLCRTECIATENMKKSKKATESTEVVKVDNEFQVSENNSKKTSYDSKVGTKLEVTNRMKAKETNVNVHDKRHGNYDIDYDRNGNYSRIRGMDYDRYDIDNDGVIEENKKTRSKLLKSHEARKFDDQHINGIHDPRKPVNSKGNFIQQPCMLLRKSGDPKGLPKLARAGQDLFMTKNAVPYTNTGVRNYGKTGKDNFVMAGKRMEDENLVVAEHLAGKPKIRDDGKVQVGDELFSQRFSQGTQYMP